MGKPLLRTSCDIRYPHCLLLVQRNILFLLSLRPDGVDHPNRKIQCPLHDSQEVRPNGRGRKGCDSWIFQIARYFHGYGNECSAKHIPDQRDLANHIIDRSKRGHHNGEVYLLSDRVYFPLEAIPIEGPFRVASLMTILPD